VVAGALVGSLANGGGDDWSDLDLTFAVDDAAVRDDVLADWSQALAERFDAVQLFDLPAGASIYRVFLLPGALQFDLSFTPAAAFRPTSPRFELLFGEALEPARPVPLDTDELAGYVAHHLLRARFCIARRRRRQAAYWLSEARNLLVAIACDRRGLPSAHGRGLDELPADAAYDDTLVRSLDEDELRRALDAQLAALRAEVHDVGHIADRIME
jgi:hypothetical protein